MSGRRASRGDKAAWAWLRRDPRARAGAERDYLRGEGERPTTAPDQCALVVESRRGHHQTRVLLQCLTRNSPLNSRVRTSPAGKTNPFATSGRPCRSRRCRAIVPAAAEGRVAAGWGDAGVGTGPEKRA